ncbi:hypothetical protein [Microbacterium testaceum]|uniref:hypothetical protein n=1 Tax=Microbacterium testaceum TaxID=2033 RepID=UPI001245B8B1|nr:hypothetical protein [Microbacterium testaceum]
MSRLSIISGGAGDNHALISPLTASTAGEVWCFIPGPHNRFTVATDTALLGEQTIDLETITVTTRHLDDGESESPEFLTDLLRPVPLRGVAADATITIVEPESGPLSVEMLLPAEIVAVLLDGTDHDVDAVLVSTFTAGRAVFTPDVVRVQVR